MKKVAPPCSVPRGMPTFAGSMSPSEPTDHATIVDWHRSQLGGMFGLEAEPDWGQKTSEMSVTARGLLWCGVSITSIGGLNRGQGCEVK